MELLILELLWWAVLFFFFWALRDARGKLGADLESLALIDEPEAATGRHRTGFQQAQKVREPIGRYQDKPIYRYAEVNGHLYQFDRVCPPDAASHIDRDELYLAPGLVYQEFVPDRNPVG
jgi:hypothetical protein